MTQAKKVRKWNRCLIVLCLFSYNIFLSKNKMRDS
jgi:hypothetical protein